MITTARNSPLITILQFLTTPETDLRAADYVVVMEFGKVYIAGPGAFSSEYALPTWVTIA